MIKFKNVLLNLCRETLYVSQKAKTEKLEMQNNGLLKYRIGDKVEAFTTMRDATLPYNVITGHQIHSYKVAVVDRPDLTREDLEGYDALVTNLPVAIGVRTADCIPVLMYDPVHRAVSATHSGWKGTVQKITMFTLSKMAAEYGTKPADIRAVIGPGIGFDSFQVGEEVSQFFKESGFPFDLIWKWDGSPEASTMHGGHHIDLKAANRWLLETAGVLPENILCSDICTFRDERFFSARREGPKCGRNINAIRLMEE